MLIFQQAEWSQVTKHRPGIQRVIYCREVSKMLTWNQQIGATLQSCQGMWKSSTIYPIRFPLAPYQMLVSQERQKEFHHFALARCSRQRWAEITAGTFSAACRSTATHLILYDNTQAIPAYPNSSPWQQVIATVYATARKTADYNPWWCHILFCKCHSPGSSAGKAMS